MTLSARIQTILQERNVKQVDFAKALGISPNYVNLLANGKKQSISVTLAKLIEETYGYPAQWVLDGSGEPLATSGVTAAKADILKKIQKMSDAEVKAALAFIETLDKINAQYSVE